MDARTFDLMQLEAQVWLEELLVNFTAAWMGERGEYGNQERSGESTEPLADDGQEVYGPGGGLMV